MHLILWQIFPLTQCQQIVYVLSNTGSFNQKPNYRKFLIIKEIKTEVAN